MTYRTFFTFAATQAVVADQHDKIINANNLFEQLQVIFQFNTLQNEIIHRKKPDLNEEVPIQNNKKELI